MTQPMQMSIGEEDSTREEARTLLEQGWEHVHELEHEHEHELELEHEHEHDRDSDDKQSELQHRKTGRAHVTSIGSVSGSSVDSGSSSNRRDAYNSNNNNGNSYGSMKSATNPKDLGLNHGSKLQQDSKRTPAPDPISRLRSRPRPHPLHPQSQSKSQSRSQSPSQAPSQAQLPSSHSQSPLRSQSHSELPDYYSYYSSSPSRDQDRDRDTRGSDPVRNRDRDRDRDRDRYRDSDSSNYHEHHHEHHHNHYYNSNPNDNNHHHNISNNTNHYDSYTYPYPNPYPYPYPYRYPTASASATNLTTYPRINSNSSASPWILEEYTASPQIPSAPISPVSPRWDSLGRGTTTPHKHVAASTPNSPLARAFFSDHDYDRDQSHSHSHHHPLPHPDEEDELHLDVDSIASESRDEFPPLPPSKLNHADGHSHVENFSRPRNLSNKQSYLESPRFRPLNHPQFDSIHHDGIGHPSSAWPRSRGPSISSNKSAATFASLPVRPPPEIYPRDSPRARGRQPHPPPARVPIAYGRAESSGPPYTRDAIPRMASLPTEELRSSYRSQLSASTAQGTLGTERSSVLTKSSSLTSVDGPLDAIDTIDDELIEDDEDLGDDDFSLSDIMGMYERGFGDDSAPEDNNEFEDSRPPTATSELNRRSMAMLLAISNPALASKPPKPAISSNANVRNSIAIRRGSAPIPYAGDVRASRIMTEIVGNGAASDTRSTQDTNDTRDDESVKETAEVGYAFDDKESMDIESIKGPEDCTDTKDEEEELISFDDVKNDEDEDKDDSDNTENIADANNIGNIADSEATEDMRSSRSLVDIEDIQDTGDLGGLEVDATKNVQGAESTGDMTDAENSSEVIDEPDSADAAEDNMVDTVVEDDSQRESDTPKENATEDIEPKRPTRQQTNLTTTDDDGRDRYGFRKTNQYITREQYDTWNEGYTEYLERRRRKWVIFLKENGLMTDTPNRFPPRSTKAKRFVRKGIPPDWRGAAWFYYAGGPAILAKHAGLYDELLKRKAKDVDVEAIERDLHRTFPDNIKFRSCNPAAGTTMGPRNSQQVFREQLAGNLRPDETPMISSLRRVLHAFSVYNPRIGYCQSLNFLAGLLLLFVESEEHAFWLLNIITRVYLPGTHEMSLEGANVDLGVLMSTLRESMPAVWAKIGGELDGTDVIRPRHRRLKQREQVRLPPITLCMTAWFMSCFIGTLPIETTLRVWDVFFYEGSKTLFRIALAIFKLGENEIRSVGDPMEIFQVVQTIPRRIINANGLMEACFKRRNGFGHLSQETIEQKRQERRDYVKAEKEKMALGDKVVTADIEATRKGTLFGRRRGS